jgi:Na+-translocating ferredoxin:NAD+ oxidoreductase RnfC subunit
MKLSESVKACGVVGAGGAGFPTHIKIGAAADTVIVNGAECEPLLASDKYLMETEGEKIVRGLRFIMEACGAKKGYIALKEKYSTQLESLSEAIGKASRNDISLFPLGDFYPAGDELILVYEIVERVVPEQGIPIQVGCLVENVETTINICTAVENKLPVTRRYLTCTGEVRNPSVVRAHVGTPIGEIIDLCSGATIDDYVVVVGGPLMGTVVTDLKTPVTKTTSGIIVLSRDHEIVRKKTLPHEFIIRQSKSVCCQCTYCTELCPRYLLGHELQPHLIMRQIGYGVDIPNKVIENALLCSGCGLCEIYACVMGLSPNKVNTMIKERLSAEEFRSEFPLRKITVNELKDYRKIPTERIINRLHLMKYDTQALERGLETEPILVEISLKQHMGAASVPVVKEGDIVQEGSLIAEIQENALGAAIHASISGEVKFIDSERILIHRK